MKYVVSLSILAVTFFALSGCSSKKAGDSAPTEPSSTAMSDSHDHSEHADQATGGQSDMAADMEKMKVELAKLSPEDAKSAQDQHVCPVSGYMLGKMGTPKKVEVNGQQVWVCCDSCKKKLLENPDEYLAKLKK